MASNIRIRPLPRSKYDFDHTNNDILQTNDFRNVAAVAAEFRIVSSDIKKVLVASNILNVAAVAGRYFSPLH